jgi:hypothetical protein
MLDQSSRQTTTGTLKIALLLLVVSNIATAVFSWHAIRSVDREYSDLLERSVPVINDIQTLTAYSAKAMRRTNPVFFGRAVAPGGGDVFALAKDAIEADRLLRESLLSKPWLPSTDAKRAEFEASGRAFTQVSNRVLELFAAKRFDEAVRLRDSESYAAFDRYQTAATWISDLLAAEATGVSRDYTESSSLITRVVLLMGGWPLILASALLGATLIFVVSLLVLFRVRESAD